MEAYTLIGSTFLAAIGGVWRYLLVHRKWRLKWLLVNAGWSGTVGAVACFILCRYLCQEPADAGLVIGLSGLIGLAGVTPKILLQFVKAALEKETHHVRRRKGEGIAKPDSDV